MANPKLPPLVGQHGLTPVLMDWWSDLNWPRVFAAARLGLRPGRLGLAFFALVAVLLLLKLGLALDRLHGASTVDWPPCPWSQDAEARDQLVLLWRMYVSLPKRLITGVPVTAVIFGPVILAVLVTMLGAVSRIAAADLSRNESIGWSEGLRFALARWHSLLGAIVGPLAIAWAIAAALILSGWLLLHVPGLNIAAAVLYGVDLLGGLVLSVLLAGYLLAHWMFIPAVACEGSDAIDAVQRGYTYFFAKPGRLLLYMACGLAGLWIVVMVMSLLLRSTVGIAAEGAGVLGGPQGQQMVWQGTWKAIGILPCLVVPREPANDLAGTWSAGQSVVQFWVTIPVLLLLAAGLSCAMSMCTALYLAMRRACDGQDWSELWLPGMIAGTMAQSLAGRAQVAKEISPEPAGTLEVEEE